MFLFLSQLIVMLIISLGGLQHHILVDTFFITIAQELHQYHIPGHRARVLETFYSVHDGNPLS